MSDTFGKDIKKLGFGLMRLPRKLLATDVEQFKAMADMFLAAGFTYFDTAYLYPGSEAAVRKALTERHPRESFLLATKLNTMVAPGEKAAKKQFYTSLERTGAGYFDFYLLHALMRGNLSKYEKFGLWDFVREQKEKGLIKHYGFSFHAGPELLDRILTEHPDVDFVQLQINYADWNDPGVQSRANWEVARKHGKPVIVMEPVKGGRLADLPQEAKDLFETCRPGMSCASWAIRFAASLDGVLTVLSGMSDIAQMKDNLSYMKDFEPLSEKEREVIRKVQAILGRSTDIPCTACGYCAAGCPKKINIPGIISAVNLKLSGGTDADAEKAYAKAVTGGGRASDCIGCGACERACPQHLEIRKHLGKAAVMFGEKAPDEHGKG